MRDVRKVPETAGENRDELLRRYLGLFTDRVEVGSDEALMEAIVRGRKRAAAWLNEDEPEPQEIDDADEKPN